VTFPTKEQYQIGAEVIDGSFEEIAKTTIMLLDEMDAKPVMQIANIRIPHLLNEKYGISLDLLRSTNIEKILQVDLPWIEKLVRLDSVEGLEDLGSFPEDIAAELREIQKAASGIVYDRIVISPLYYAKMRYYESLTFKMFEGNTLLAMGGTYVVDGTEAAGFALYTDECIANKMSRE
jgi:hypothetical protein